MKKKYSTHIRAIDPLDGKLKAWAGPDVPGNNEDEAALFCANNGLGYLHIIGEVGAEVEARDVALWRVLGMYAKVKRAAGRLEGRFVKYPDVDLGQADRDPASEAPRRPGLTLLG